MKFVIVESPTKARTIGKFLGSGYVVESSYGHVRDLPKGGLGVDVDNNFDPHYVIPRTAQTRVTKLKHALSDAEEVILATDEDREGEAIAWHLLQVLKLNKEKSVVSRIVFHEITEHAINEALSHPRDIDMHLVDAQQARRVLDRLVGYKLSPFLWKKIAKGLSAGRVQSVALRLVVDREVEIRAFKKDEYWTIDCVFGKKDNTKNEELIASLYEIDGKTLDKLGIKNKDEADAITEQLQASSFKAESIEKKEVRKNPPTPFITSTLQQEASKRLKFSAKKTMMLAQNLYEHGFITYMRTDSLNLSQEFLKNAKSYIEQSFGKEYVLSSPRIFKKKSRLAQEAHEAIRPTHVERVKEAVGEDRDLQNLYDLIWRRSLASQFPEARFDSTTVIVHGAGDKNKNEARLRAHGAMLKFDGFLKVWPQKFEERDVPPVKEGEAMTLVRLDSEQHFTEPPPRFNEASLIKALEGFGIGRPSTYAPTLSTIQERNYVVKEEGRFYPTEIGEMVTRVLKEHFPNIVDFDFTAKMEEELDQIAEGKEEWQEVIGNFYKPFSENLNKKYEEVGSEKAATEETDEVCEKCGKKLLIKMSRFGKFLACSGYPECKFTKKIGAEIKKIGMACPECGKGEVIEKHVRKGRSRGKIFWGCSLYPECKYASWEYPKKGENPPISA